MTGQRKLSFVREDGGKGKVKKKGGGNGKKGREKGRTNEDSDPPSTTC